MSFHRVMVDIEDVGGVILSIGWARFSPALGVHDGSYDEVRLDIQPQLDAGLKVQASTLDWWLKQTALPWREGLEPIEPEQALSRFSQAVSHADEVWAKSPQYDLTKLRTAHAAFAIHPLWHFRTERDFRTLNELPSSKDLRMKPLAGGTKHGALVDAIHQATEAAVMLQALGDKRE